MGKGNVGDRIRVVLAEHNEGYENGDTGVIVSFESGLSGAEIRIDGAVYYCEDESHYLYPQEYEIIEQEASLEAHQEAESIPWEVGQEVFCLLRGKGAVSSVETNTNLFSCGVTVSFYKHGPIRYNLDGKISTHMNRSLFFSEPKIIADKFPPKKPFVPVLNEGDVVVAVYKEDKNKIEKFVVVDETEDHVEFSEFGDAYIKSCWDFYKLGEKVEFNV